MDHPPQGHDDIANAIAGLAYVADRFSRAAGLRRSVRAIHDDYARNDCPRRAAEIAQKTRALEMKAATGRAMRERFERANERNTMADKFTMPKGRQTIRKSGGRRTRLWELGGSSNPTVARLEAAYLAGLDAMDRAEARHAANKADTRFTPDGVRDDLLKFVLNDAVPALHRGRTAIKKARAEVAERRAKLKIEGPDKTDVAAAFRRMEIRTRLREMKPDELTNYFARYGDNLPTEIAQAVTELPAEYSRRPAVTTRSADRTRARCAVRQRD